MIVYSANKTEFVNDVLTNQIDQKILTEFKKTYGHSTGKSEISSWKNSLQYIHNILVDPEIPEDSGVAIEYRVPQSMKRVDVIVTGKDENQRESAVLIELKQWQSAKKTTMDGIVSTYVGGAVRDVPHPSYQAWSYASLLQDFSETVENDNIFLQPCAYLHNYTNDGVITNLFYNEYLEKAPLFLREDALKLRDFIKKFVKYGDTNKLLYRIDNGRIRPSKYLADELDSLLQGNLEFVMIDDQKIVFEQAMALAKSSNPNNKNVLIVQGGPGTGKSVVAVNLLVKMINNGLNAKYVTKNAAPRAVYEQKLTYTTSKTRISNLFSGSGSFFNAQPNEFDSLIVDEAHRLNAKSGLFQNLGENQIKELILSSCFSVFFLDEDQRVTLNDIGQVAEIKKWAEEQGATVSETELSTQFRCNGSDGYISWLDNTLQIRETVNTTLEGINYDFQVFDDPNEMRELIYEKNKLSNKARMVAGYCWDWISKKNPNAFDIDIPKYDFQAQWNLNSYGSLWIISPESVKEVGCIHTCQGLEVDYIGVIIGPDFLIRDGKVITDASRRSKADTTIKGYKKMLAEDPISAKEKAGMIIKNTYRTLMTRGQKGCYVFCEDEETREWFRNLQDDK